MKRLQIMIEEEMDEALERVARQENVSKAALIRSYVRDRLAPLPPIEDDPLWEMIGAAEDVPAAAVDDVVYPR